MNEQQRVNNLKNAIKDAFNSVLPDSIPADVLVDIKSKNENIANTIASAINSFCKALTVEVSLSNGTTREVIGVTSQRENVTTSLPVNISSNMPGAYSFNASAELKIHNLSDLFTSNGEHTLTGVIK